MWLLELFDQAQQVVAVVVVVDVAAEEADIAAAVAAVAVAAAAVGEEQARTAAVGRLMLEEGILAAQGFRQIQLNSE